jgi:hypothetical protein
MTRTWTDLEGVTLGRYWLKVCLTFSPDDAWYLIRYDTTRDAAVRVRSAAAPDAETQLDLWRRATAIEHPHIVRMFDAGRARVEEGEYIYCVCEYPDDFLAGVLTERPLLPSEAREILDAALAALAFLHDHNFVHAAVDTNHIMAFGETIKLPSDTIRLAGAGPDESAAADLHALGALLHEVLTREVPRPDAKTDFSYLPEPFRSIIRHTVRPEGAHRWTIEDIRNHLNPPPPKPEPLPPAEAAAAAEQRAEESEAEKAPAAPIPIDRPTLPPPRPRPEPVLNRPIPLKWIPIAGLAAAAALGAIVLRQPGDAGGKKPGLAAPIVQPSAPAKTAPGPATPPAVTPQPPKESPFKSERADRAARPDRPDARPSTGAPIWRVIAYTYNGRTNAEKKAKSINEKYPNFEAAVFTPKGEGAPYLISLGGRMTLAEAERLQRQAWAKGFPRDTFIRNFAN